LTERVDVTDRQAIRLTLTYKVIGSVVEGTDAGDTDGRAEAVEVCKLEVAGSEVAAFGDSIGQVVC
jgi:hypothetical protein